MGYYSRARNLHKTAKTIVNDYNGNIPQDSKTLQTLPGVGPYIAAAIASIAFNEPIAVVDGNVLRVITRFFGIKDDIGKEATKQKIQQRLNQIIKTVAPNPFNQGLMELGATVCSPKNPACNDCPIKDMCYAKNMNATDELPVKQKKAPIPHNTIVVGIIKRADGKLLITKRKKDQLLGGLWEFPGGKVEPKESLETALIREIKEEVNLDISINGFLCKVNHAYSHFKITMHAYECEVEDASSISCNSADTFEWISAESLDNFAFLKQIKLLLSTCVKQTNLNNQK